MHIVATFPLALAAAWLADRVVKSRRRKQPAARNQAAVPGEATADIPAREALDGPQDVMQEPSGFPGPFSPHDLADPLMRAVPVTVYPGITEAQAAELDSRYLYISSDCAEVHIGNRYLGDVLLPRAIQLVTDHADQLASVPALVWNLLIANVAPATNPAVDCLRTIPDFAHADVTEHGQFANTTTDHEAYLEAWESFRAERPQVSDLWEVLMEALLAHPEIQRVLEIEVE